MDVFSDDFSITSKEFSILLDASHLNNAEPICISCSSLEFSKNYELLMDNQLEKFTFDPIQEPEKLKKKRGRKPLRPNDPIQKKTEIKDKYWFRAFRNFIKNHWNSLQVYCDESSKKFWNVFISKVGKPGKGNLFLSYGKRYKSFLFGEKTFASMFKAWFLHYGEVELVKKYEKGSDFWFIYYDYALQEIAKEGTEWHSYRELFKKLQNRENTTKNTGFLPDSNKIE